MHTSLNLSKNVNRLFAQNINNMFITSLTNSNLNRFFSNNKNQKRNNVSNYHNNYHNNQNMYNPFNNVKNRSNTKSNTKNIPKININAHFTINNKTEYVRFNKQLGKGGEGTVYTIDNLDKKYVAKIYHKIDPNHEAKLKYMIDNKPTHITGTKFIICWPEYILYDNNNKFIGYIMRKGFDNSFELYELTKPNSKKIKTNKFNNSNNGIITKLKLIINICIPINHIHNSNQYVMVDFKPQNVLTDVNGNISILDTDSFQISENNKIKFNARVATPEYTPKEYTNVVPSKIKYDVSTDMFAVAVSFYQILLGIHPYVVKPINDKLTTIADFIYNDLFAFGNKSNNIKALPNPHNNFNILPPEIQELFKKTFNTIYRPNTADWGQTIADVINNAIKNKTSIIDLKANNVKLNYNSNISNNKVMSSVDKLCNKAIINNNLLKNNNVESNIVYNMLDAITILKDFANVNKHSQNPSNNRKAQLAIRCMFNLTMFYLDIINKHHLDVEALNPMLEHLKAVLDVFNQDGSTNISTAKLSNLNKYKYNNTDGNVLINNIIYMFASDVDKIIDAQYKVNTSDDDVNYIYGNLNMYSKNSFDMSLNNIKTDFTKYLESYKDMDNCDISSIHKTIRTIIKIHYIAKYKVNLP